MATIGEGAEVALLMDSAAIAAAPVGIIASISPWASTGIGVMASHRARLRRVCGQSATLLPSHGARWRPLSCVLPL